MPADLRIEALFSEALAILIIPASVGLALVAPDFVLLVFGPKWHASVVPLRILCLYTAINILGTVATPVLQMTGQAGFPARCGIATLMILPPAFFFAGTRWGTVGIAAIWLSVYPLILVPVYARVFKTLGIRLRDYLACLGPTLMGAAVMTLVVTVIRSAAPAAWPLSIRFTVQVLCGAAAFVIAGLFIQRRRLTVLADFVRTIRA